MQDIATENTGKIIWMFQAEYLGNGISAQAGCLQDHVI
jgi:hypothetical protein